MDRFSDEDQKLMEEIRKVKVVKKKVPSNFDLLVSIRHLHYSIFDFGEEAIVEFFNAIKDNLFTISSAWRLSIILDLKKLASKNGYILIKNKKHDAYRVFKKEDKKQAFMFFNPDMLIEGETDEKEVSKEN